MSWQPYIKPPARCGTDAGYYRHLDYRTRTHNEPVCDACRKAHAEATRRRRVARRRTVDTYRWGRQAA